MMKLSLTVVCVIAAITSSQAIDFIPLGVTAPYMDPPGSGKFFQKSYFLSNENSHWVQAYAKCRENGMKLANVAEKQDSKDFLKLLNQNVAKFAIGRAHVGGVGVEKPANKVWFWFDDTVKISFGLNWSPGEPNDVNGGENCLGVSANIYSEKKFGYNDILCYGASTPFICHKVSNATLTK